MGWARRLQRALRERAVWKPIVGYIAAGWIALQVADQFVDRLHLPERVYSLTLLAVVLGFGVVTVTALVQSRRSARRPAAPSSVLEHLLTWKHPVFAAAVVVLMVWSIGVVSWVLFGSRAPQAPPLAEPTAVGQPSQLTPLAEPTSVGQPSRLTTFYLFDVSVSFRPRLAHSLQLLAPTAEAVYSQTHWGKQRHAVVTIGEAGPSGLDLLCDFEVASPPTAVERAVFAQRVSQCLRRLDDILEARTTDISTSLRLAALGMQRIRPGTRAILMFTDLEEYLEYPPYVGAEEVDLAGVCVGAVVDTPFRLRELEQRISEWNARLADWRAYRIQFWHRLAFEPGDFLEFLKLCSA